MTHSSTQCFWNVVEKQSFFIGLLFFNIGVINVDLFNALQIVRRRRCRFEDKG
jgi:hypothetical protein